MQDDFKCQSGGNNVMDFKAPSKYTGKSLNPIPNVIMNINKTYVEQEV